MNYRLILKILGRIQIAAAAVMLPAMAVSIFAVEHRAVFAFMLSILIMLIAGLPCARINLKSSKFQIREGFVTVGLAWITVSVSGSLPYLISGEIQSVVDALFESVSGFSTTGATVIKDIESLPSGILYWRSFTNWMGGMGVLVFILAIGPFSSGESYSISLLRAELPGPSYSKLAPRLHRSALILYVIYIALTLSQVLLLAIGGTPIFDSFNISFATAGTGGFSIKNDSLASYSEYTQTVTEMFMFIYSINFSLYFLLAMREFKKIAKNEELRVYILILAVATALISINIRPLYGSEWEATREALFQSASIMSTTGYASVNFRDWPQFSRVLLMLLMMVGACGGSTGGGIKVSRAMLMVKSVRASILNVLRPNSVNIIHMDGEVVTDDTIKTLNGFMMIYALIILGSVLVLSIDNMSLETNISAVLACISNVGVGFGSIGSMLSYDVFSGGEKLLLCLNMLLGRLELFPILILFTPSVWKR